MILILRFFVGWGPDPIFSTIVLKHSKNVNIPCAQFSLPKTEIDLNSWEIYMPVDIEKQNK